MLHTLAVLNTLSGLVGSHSLVVPEDSLDLVEDSLAALDKRDDLEEALDTVAACQTCSVCFDLQRRRIFSSLWIFDETLLWDFENLRWNLPSLTPCLGI